VLGARDASTLWLARKLESDLPFGADRTIGMRICVLGLDCAAPEVIFRDDRLVNIRRLMGRGVFGRLESVIPPITVPAWMCMTTSQDPGSLGVYGFRNRTWLLLPRAGIRHLQSN